ncbi:hypothetical protein KRM28CT15_47470 [Krasilnikovia sp. M28-CT-15]
MVLECLRSRDETRPFRSSCYSFHPAAEDNVRVRARLVQAYARRPVDFARPGSVVRSLDGVGFEVRRNG